jgi:hypothetical protein
MVGTAALSKGISEKRIWIEIAIEIAIEIGFGIEPISNYNTPNIQRIGCKSMSLT